MIEEMKGLRPAVQKYLQHQRLLRNKLQVMNTFVVVLYGPMSRRHNDPNQNIPARSFFATSSLFDRNLVKEIARFL